MAFGHGGMAGNQVSWVEAALKMVLITQNSRTFSSHFFFFFTVVESFKEFSLGRGFHIDPEPLSPYVLVTS